jgi:hypothetical protein
VVSTSNKVIPFGISPDIDSITPSKVDASVKKANLLLSEADLLVTAAWSRCFEAVSYPYGEDGQYAKVS